MVHVGTLQDGEVRVGTFFFQNADIETVSETITAGIEQIQMPLSGPSQVLLFDFQGVTNEITIDGYITAATTDRSTATTPSITISAQKIILKAFMSGNQSPVEFESRFNPSSDSVKVMIDTINYTESSGDPNRLKISMKLVEGQG